MKIKIEKRFKESIEKRFNYVNRKEWKNIMVIEQECSLCREYLEFATKVSKCPFNNNKYCQCIEWICKGINEKPKFTINNKGFIYWHKEDGKIVKKQLAKLRKYAEENIEWI